MAHSLYIVGRGSPGGEAFTHRVGALYSIAYPVKMTRKAQGLHDYVICKLESQCWFDNETTDIGTVSLYRDDNENGIPEAVEKIATGNFASDDGEVTFILSQPYPLPLGETHFLVTYQFLSLAN
ncbi:hypothetical protein ACFL6N_01755 [Thermodesulfobacteriota bacterium]